MNAPHSAMLRAAIHEGPSEKSWAIVCASLDHIDDAEKLIAFADKYVNTWPEPLRVAPTKWWLDLIAGRPQPRWRLARALHLKNKELPAGLDVATALSAHAATRQIAHLSLAGLELGDEAMAAIVSSTRVAQLESLDASANLLGPAAILAFARSHLGELESLDLSSNNFDARSMEVLLAANRLAKLRSLSARACGLGVDAARAIAESEGLVRLAELDLSYNPLGDRGAGAIAASPFASKLHRLALKRTELGALGLKALLASSSLAGAIELELRENGLALEAPDPRVAV